ncbi:MAG: hypothetical protein ACK5B9_01965 [Flavobacteriia bacterium]|jgi:hypothetical protein
MNNITKKLFFAGIFIFAFGMSSFGQVLKLKSTSLATTYLLNNYDWSDWSEWEETTVLITIDVAKERITIYSKETQIYDVAENEGTSVDKEGDEIMSFYCIDDEGVAVRVKIVTLHSRDGNTQLYVEYSNMKWVYNVYFLD